MPALPATSLARSCVLFPLLGALLGGLLGLAPPAAAAADTVVRLTPSDVPLVDGAGQRWASDRELVQDAPPLLRRHRLTGVRSSRQPVAGTVDDALFQTQRTGAIRYRVPVGAAGTYRVVLHQAELWLDAPGRRVFDVRAEGLLKVSALDVHARVGRLHALQVPFDVLVTDGVLDLRFVPRAGSPAVGAISLSLLPDPAAPPAVGDALAPGTRPFGASSAWNTRVPTSPVLDPAGPAMVGYLAGGANPGIAALYEFGVPIWEADASTPRHAVDCVRAWGTCQLEQQRVPVPPEARPSSGSDAAMVVVDDAARTAYEFWEARRTATGWQAGWGGVVSLDGSGTPGAAVGSGISRLAGVVRIREVQQGRIDHALVFSTNNACQSVRRYPASKTDGASARADCIPEGARVQLDPSLDVAALPGLSKGERMVAQALQTYGAYAIDNGGANMAFIFETPSGEADPYPGVGFGWDYFGMDRIPWSRLRVLRAWDGR